MLRQINFMLWLFYWFLIFTKNFVSSNQNNEIDCKKLNFVKRSKDVNALASFPGSGNTWLRDLLQNSSGLLTGSVYRDFELENGGFKGEFVQDSSVLIVKTHQLPSEPWPKYERAVILIRNPFKTLLAEFNRRTVGHIGFVPINKFLQRKDWVEFVMTELKNWKNFYIEWFNFKKPILLVRYEDLLTDVHCQLKRILFFLGQSGYQRLTKCVLNKKNDRFKRAGILYPFDPFSIKLNGTSLRKLVEKERKFVYKNLKELFENNEIVDCKI